MYMIIRYHKTQKRKIIQTCVTLDAAQRICSDPATSAGPDGQWFYGYATQRYRVVNRSGRTIKTNLTIREAEDLSLLGGIRSIKPVDRF
jgi:hypothetical protein